MSTGEAVGESASDGVGLDLESVSNVLVLAPSMDEDARRAYYEQLLPDDPGSIDVLGIEYRRTPDRWLDEWQRYAGGRPRRSAIICVDETTRSAAASAGTAGALADDPDTATTVENPGDLTGLGITISEYLSAHGSTETVLTFDSLTVLLQFVDLQRAFRFLHVLTNRVDAAGAVGHYHMDPDAHSDREVATLSSLFDAVATYADGGWDVQRR